MTGRAHVPRLGPLAALAFALIAVPAAAQTMTGLPNALQGFSVNREKPVRITSATLEVRDKEKRATFIGNVLVAQGDTTMKSKTLDVFYEADGEATEGSTTPGSGQQIRKLEAKGGVLVTQKDQTATGETGLFDMRANTVTLLGNVVITQGGQVIRGERLTVDLTTGISHVEGGVQGLFLPNSRPRAGDAKADGKPAEARAETREGKPEPGRGKDAAKPAAKTKQGEPLKLN
jgi:lipopolysaccharide export system protein LptA